ncbi:MAG: BACON domain-containing protein [Bacteroidales bacterium]|nr:BACON domain-containing protein [Bacteroidales bacterium]
MKIKNIIAALFAVLALTVGCAVEGDHFLDEVKVSTSYVALSMNGGSATMEVNATESWSISGAPSWLTISPASGSAGQSTVTFSAPTTLDGRTAEVVLTCGGKTQNINVIQGLAVVSPATCAEVIAGPDSKTYLVTGTVTAIANDQYGNWYLTDKTGTIYIYGTVNSTGKYPKDSGGWGKSPFDFSVGDEITVQGPKTTYNGTVELVDVTVVKLSKSLIKVDSVDPENKTFPVDGGDMKVTLSNKGTGVYVDIPADAKDWLSISAIAGDVVTLTAAPNAGGDRDTKLVFKTKSGGKDYTTELTVAQKGSIIAASVADFLAAPVGNTQYRITGVITSVANASYGNVYIRDWSGEAYIYGIGAKGDFQNLGLKVGDVVTLVGKRGEYKGAAQMTGGQYETHIPVTEVTIAEFLTKPDDKNVYYMVTGTLDEIANATYGNVYINDGAGNRLYSYGCYPGWGATGDARKNAIANLDIHVGDQLTLIGAKTTYNGAPQINNGVYFSHVPAN